MDVYYIKWAISIKISIIILLFAQTNYWFISILYIQHCHILENKTKLMYKNVKNYLLKCDKDRNISIHLPLNYREESIFQNIIVLILSKEDKKVKIYNK